MCTSQALRARAGGKWTRRRARGCGLWEVLVRARAEAAHVPRMLRCRWFNIKADAAMAEGAEGGWEGARRKKHHVSMPKWGRKKCEHNKRRNECKDCGGAGICQHNRLQEELQGLQLEA